MRAVIFSLVLTSASAYAETVVPAFPIRAGTVIEASHLAIVDQAVSGALDDMRDAIGLEARVNLYPNRPVYPADLGAPTLVGRNEQVELIYRVGGLRISVAGRALSRAGAGEFARAMNLGSRATVMGIVTGPGRIEVSQ